MLYYLSHLVQILLKALENIIPNGALYCSLMGAVLSQSPGSNLIESTRENIIPNGALYCSLMGAVLSQSPGSNLIESTRKNIIPNGALYCSLMGAVLSQSPGSKLIESTAQRKLLTFNVNFQCVIFSGLFSFPLNKRVLYVSQVRTRGCFFEQTLCYFYHLSFTHFVFLSRAIKRSQIHKHWLQRVWLKLKNKQHHSKVLLNCFTTTGHTQGFTGIKS